MLLGGFSLAHLVEYAGPYNPEWHAEIFGYIAPEQSGLVSRRVDERTDLYLVGVLLYHMIAGRLPVSGESVTAFVHHHFTAMPDPSSRLAIRPPDTKGRVVMRLLEKEPDCRYQSASGLKADLERLIRGEADFIPGLDDHAIWIDLTGPLVGRDRELDQLKRLHALTRRGRTILYGNLYKSTMIPKELTEHLFLCDGI